MPRGPVRRGQLIAPFGVGAMLVARDGSSLIAAGLDHWFELETGLVTNNQIDAQEFIVEEWRLQSLLRVNHFRLPPDYRISRPGDNSPNYYLTIPFLRFPQWCFCPGCYRLYKLPLSLRMREKCAECEKKQKRRFLVQVPFVAMCDHGHLQDFPWSEWVHRMSQPACDQPIRLVATGGATLAAQKVKCDCGMERSLGHIMEADLQEDRTFLSSNLDNRGKIFLCQGKRPWLGSEDGELCQRPLRGSLRSSSNIYYADIRSAIYLPRRTKSAPPDLVALFEKPPLSTLVKLLSGAGAIITAIDLRNQHSALLNRYSDEQIESAVGILILEKDQKQKIGSKTEPVTENYHEHFRMVEYDALRTEREEEELFIKAANINEYKQEVVNYFSRIMLVKKLRETRAFAGFTRVFPDNGLGLEQRVAMLSRNPRLGEDAWLPAYVVYGEGIFLEFKEALVKEWEARKEVAARVQPLIDRYHHAQETRRLRERQLTPRFVLLHTFAHLLMNQLTFECGYSSAALRERIYASAVQNVSMAGILIYTAAGDAEGTMGGLVGMAKPGHLEPVIQKAIDKARWCSADPVCLEMGSGGGQGPDSCNLAACHNCALVPETACEEFNRFLDRAFVVGGIRATDLGFFSQ